MKAIVIGAGVSGLFTAYMLASRHGADVVVVEERYPGSGGTMRCATGVRASFTSKHHVELMKRGLTLWEELSRGELGELGLRLYRHGYLWLARREESLEEMKKLSEFHNSLGVPTRVVDADEAAELAPLLDKSRVVGGLYDPTAGKAPVFEAVRALLRALRGLGVEVMIHTKATRIVAGGEGVERVETSRGPLRGDAYVLAAGHEAARLAATAGLELPLVNEPKHVVITEAYEYTLRPLLVDWDTPGAPYIVQTLDGGFYMSRDIEDTPSAPLDSHRVDAMPRIVAPLAELVPSIRRMNILRYWMGYYVVTPDHHPIYGPPGDGGPENLYLAVGFSGHGYMLGPVTGELLADWITRGRPRIRAAEELTLERFREGRLVEEKAVIG